MFLSRYMTLNEVCEQADVISLHAPLTAHTHHCINLDTISRMKDGVVIINTSRGGLLDTKVAT